MRKPLVTILTATYNRVNTLPRLYYSLKCQHRDLVWFVVDDGSTDNTEKVVKSWLNKSTFKIKYLKKKNGGKHRAINVAIPYLATPLVMIVDSDDYITDDCLTTIEYYWNKYRNIPKLGSMIFERGISDQNTPMVKIEKNVIAPRFEYIEKQRLYGDYSDVFICKALKQFRLPEFKGENFISEGPLYFKFSEKYNSAFIGKVITIGNYRKDGLTKHSRMLKIKNYHGALYDLQLSMSNRAGLYGQVKHAILYDYIAIACPASIIKLLKDSKHILLTFLLLPVGWLFYLKDLYLHNI